MFVQVNSLMEDALSVHKCQNVFVSLHLSWLCFLCLGLNDSEEMSLIDIMVCSCKQAATRQGPPGRTVRKGKEKKSSTDDKKNLSAHFMQTLPRLLNKVRKKCV